MRVMSWVAAGLGLGACGGFVAGLLRDRPDHDDLPFDGRPDRATGGAAQTKG